MMLVQWPDAIDEVLGGDLTAALSHMTPAGGVVVTAVAPIAGGREGANAGRAERTPRPRGGFRFVHHLARVRPEARADRARSTHRARLPRARARPIAEPALRARSRQRNGDQGARPRAPGLHRAPGDAVHGPAGTRTVLGPLAFRVLRRPGAGARRGAPDRELAGPSLRRRAGGARRAAARSA